MFKGKLLTVVVVLVVLVGTSVYAEDWKVGEKWVYKHEGPRPFATASTQVKGDRTVEVVAIKGKGAEKRYLLKSLYGTEDVMPTTAHIDSRKAVHKLDIQDLAVCILKPAVPTIWPLKTGEQKTFKTSMDIGGFAVPIEYLAKRLKDETVTVPAGKFEKCQHVQIIVSTHNEIGEPVKHKQDYWYHPKVRNIVMDKVITNYEGGTSYTATSTLKSHTTKD